MKKLLLLILVWVGSFSARAQWVAQPAGLAGTDKIPSVSVVNANVAWAYTNTAILRTTNGGATWLSMPFNITVSSGGPIVSLIPKSIHALDANTAYLVTIAYAGHANYIRIYKTTDGGLNWSRQNSAYVNDYRVGTISVADFVYFFDQNNGLIFGDTDTGYFEIYTTANAGQVWNRIPAANLPASTINDLSIPGHLYEAHADTIWVGVKGMRILKSTDKGLHWTVSNTGIVPAINDYDATIKGIAFSDASNGLVTYTASATSNTVLKRTTDGGQTWTTVNYTGPVGKYDLEAVPGIPGAYMATSGGSNGLGSAITYDNGNSWTSIDTNLKHYDIELLNKNTGWTTSDGVLYKLNIVLSAGKELTPIPGFIISPNPGNGNITISNSSAQPFRLEVYNITGNVVLRQKGQTFGPTFVNLSNQLPGVYLARILSNNRYYTQRIIIQ